MTDISYVETKSARSPVGYALVLLWAAIKYSVRVRCVGPYFAVYKVCLSLRSVWAVAASGWALAILGWGLLIAGFIWQWWRMTV